MKRYAISSILFLCLLAMAPAFASTAPATTVSSPPSVPPGLTSYVESLANNASASHCAEGTVSPFTVKAVACTPPDSAVPQTMTTDCSVSGGNNCQNGGFTTDSSGYYGLQADSTAPTNPTVSPAYSNPTSFSDWIGIQSCNSPSSCSSGTNYLLQGGEGWGINSTYSSSNPGLFIEFYETSGHCASNYCGLLGPAVSVSDGLYFSVTYYSTSQWELYSQDTTKNHYISYYVTVGSGSGEIPYSAGTHLQYGTMISEGQGPTASNQFPAGMNMYDVIGYDTSSYNYYLGSHTAANWPSSGLQSVTLAWSTGTCTWGSNTCGDQDIIVS